MEELAQLWDVNFIFIYIIGDSVYHVYPHGHSLLASIPNIFYQL